MKVMHLVTTSSTLPWQLLNGAARPDHCHAAAGTFQAEHLGCSVIHGVEVLLDQPPQGGGCRDYNKLINIKK